MISKSKNLKEFKNEVGQLNHFLITIEVGLHNISSDTKLPDDFRSSWNPKDYKHSVCRSEIWARKAALTYICSTIEAYFESIYNEPCLVQDTDLINKYQNIKERRHISPPISYKLNAINDAYGISIPEKDLVKLMIFWRNGLVHHLKEFNGDPKYVEVKENLTGEFSKKFFHDNYCNLDIERLINDFEQRKIPAFKEITSMVKASIKYVYCVDGELLKNMEKEKYVIECIKASIEMLSHSKKQEFIKMSKERKESCLKTLLEQFFSFEKGENEDLKSLINNYVVSDK